MQHVGKWLVSDALRFFQLPHFSNGLQHSLLWKMSVCDRTRMAQKRRDLQATRQLVSAGPDHESGSGETYVKSTS